ncbi:MAG: hypothetical protein M0Z95_18880 [Actinomycetota bacterium]|jgi:amino acid transporter|nr:hypothetical protein [Actinomycetota bacterium]
MSRRQFGYLVGFLLVWLAWAASWVVVAALAAGVVGYLVVRALESDIDFGELTERFRSDRRP